jgi:hypothetical protein
LGVRHVASASASLSSTPSAQRLTPISATGDILTGRTAAQYGLLGATSCQMHTLFQLPDTEFGARTRNKAEAALHHLLLHPTTGLVPWLLHLRRVTGRAELNWLDLPKAGLSTG